MSAGWIPDVVAEGKAASGWQPIADVDPYAGFIIGGFYTVEGDRYARPLIADLKHKDWPKRIEFYVGKQRVFPTHFLSIPDAPVA